MRLIVAVDIEAGMPQMIYNENSGLGWRWVGLALLCASVAAVVISEAVNNSKPVNPSVGSAATSRTPAPAMVAPAPQSQPAVVIPRQAPAIPQPAPLTTLTPPPLATLPSPTPIPAPLQKTAPVIPPPAPATAPVAVPSTAPTTAPARNATLPAALVSLVQEATAQRTYRCSPLVGGAFAPNPFEDVAPDGVLIGLRLGMGKFFDNDVIKSVQPIYLTPAGEKLGRLYGKERSLDLIEMKAPEGCAVAAASIRGGGGLDALTVTFMPINGTRLDGRTEAFITPRVGGPGGGESYIGGDGTPVIGICGRFDDKGEWLGLGLVFLHPTPAAKPHRN